MALPHREAGSRTTTGEIAGAVTFLFTDIEGSTRLWETEPAAMQAALAHHDAVLCDAIQANGGRLVKTTGDGAYAAFTDAGDALGATLMAQRALENIREVRLRSRMALHTGIAEHRDGDYYGPALNRAARLMAAGYGGQILLSQETARLVRDRLPEHVTLRDMGERRLKDLVRAEHVYQVVADDLASDFPPLRTLDARPNNLPAQTTPFIGRTRELRSLLERLRAPATRLVTLSGVGGSGKTRLSLQAAAEMIDEFEHGVFFVPLAAVCEPARILAAIAQSVGVHETGERPIGVLVEEHLKSREILLVLDNFEQVVDAGPDIAALLQIAPRLKVIVTSREVLRLSAETEHPLPPFATPPPAASLHVDALMQYEAVAFFVSRAAAVRPGFALGQANAAAVAGICRRVEGLPLALELAAARVRTLTPAAILQALDHRLDFLRDGARDLPDRQRTLRGAIAWSHDLLNDGERAMFRRMAVMVGSGSLHALEVVCSLEDKVDALATIESLVAKSLVRGVESDAEPRFTMLETVRDFAQERLAEAGEAEALHERHLHYFLALAEKAEPELTGTAQGAWLSRLDADHDNLRAALEWSLRETCSEPALRMCGALQRFWFTRGCFSEGRGWCARALRERVHARRTPALASAINTEAVLAYLQADYGAARTLLEECLALRRELGDLPGIAESLNDLGSVFQYQGDYAVARRLLEEALEIRRRLGDRRGAATTLNNLGNLALSQDDPQASKAMFEECLAILRELGDRRSVGIVLMNLGGTAYQQGDHSAARAVLDESVAIMRELDDPWGIASALHTLGDVVLAQGDVESARALYREALAIAHRLGDMLVVAAALQGLADAAALLGALFRAARNWGAAEMLRETIRCPMPRRERTLHDRAVRAARDRVGDEASFERAWQEGRCLALEQVIREAQADDATHAVPGAR